MECGSTTAFELPDSVASVYAPVVTYSRKTYFNVIMDRAIFGGTIVDHDSRHWLESKFVIMISRFNEIKGVLGCKSFPSYVYMFIKLCKIRGISVVGLKPPKMQSTLMRAERVWLALESCVAEFTVGPLDLEDGAPVVVGELTRLGRLKPRR